MSDIRAYYGQPLFIVYTLLNVAVLGAFYALTRHLEPIRDDLLCAFVAYDEVYTCLFSYDPPYITLYWIISFTFVNTPPHPITIMIILTHSYHRQASDSLDTIRMREYKHQIATINAVYAPYQKLHPLAYCCLAGLIGAWSVLQAKAVHNFYGQTSIIDVFAYCHVYS